MRKYLLPLLSVVINLSGFSQNKLGYTEHQIKTNEFPNKEFIVGYTTDSIKWISWEDANEKCVYYFSEDKICNFVTVKPKNVKTLKEIIKKVSSESLVINDSLWVENSNGDEIKVKLNTSSNGVMYFAFTSKKYPLTGSSGQSSYVLKTDTSPQFDEINGSYYRNTKYKFRVHLVDNWIIDKGGPFDHIVIRSYQPDSGKSLTIFIVDYLNVELKDEPISESLKKSVIDALRNQGINPTNFRIKKGWLNNFPANIIGYEMIRKDGAHEIPYTLRQVD